MVDREEPEALDLLCSNIALIVYAIVGVERAESLVLQRSEQKLERLSD